MKIIESTLKEFETLFDADLPKQFKMDVLRIKLESIYLLGKIRGLRDAIK